VHTVKLKHTFVHLFIALKFVFAFSELIRFKTIAYVYMLGKYLGKTVLRTLVSVTKYISCVVNVMIVFTTKKLSVF